MLGLVLQRQCGAWNLGALRLWRSPMERRRCRCLLQQQLHLLSSDGRVHADCHAGADLLDYKDFLEARWHDDFDAWAAEPPRGRDGTLLGTTNDGQLEPARYYSSKQILKFVRDIAERQRIVAPDAID